MKTSWRGRVRRLLATKMLGSLRLGGAARSVGQPCCPCNGLIRTRRPVAGEQSARQRASMHLAQQVVGDETLNPALSVADRRRTTSVADARLLRCLGE